MTGACALLMYFSMIINESLVARTFGTYTLQLFDAKQADWLVPALGVGLLIFAFGINLLKNQYIQWPTRTTPTTTTRKRLPHEAG